MTMLPPNGVNAVVWWTSPLAPNYVDLTCDSASQSWQEGAKADGFIAITDYHIFSVNSEHRAE